MESLRKSWHGSKIFRFFLIAALVWFVLRLLFQVIFTAGLFPELTGDSGLPADLPVYMNAARHFQLRQPIYPLDLNDATNNYPYSPVYAMISQALLWLPSRLTAMLSLAMLLASYMLVYYVWMRIFDWLGLTRVKDQMVRTLPVWLIFAPFWGGVAYLNVGILVVLITSLLIKFILEERLVYAVPLLTFLLISKVMWAFPLALPLLLGQRKFFLKLLAFSVLAYLALVGISCLAAGPSYVLQQYASYFDQLNRLTRDFPWQVASATPYFGLNHSVKQTVIFLLGVQPWVFTLAAVIKILLLLPLTVVVLRFVLHPHKAAKSSDLSTNDLALDLAFVLYLGAFLWLDIVWELLLGIVIFPYLLASLQKTWENGLVWGLFLLYAIVDIIDLVSYIVGGDSLIDMHGEYILTDPSTYVPLTLFVIFLFYFFLIRRLWQNSKPISAI